MYMEVVRIVDVMKVVGKFYILWVVFVKLYEFYVDVVNVRVIFEKVVMVNYKVVDDFVSVWCEWVEMEFWYKNFKGVLDLM